MKSTILTATRSAVDLLFPARCVHCGSDGNLFCDRCVSQSTRLKPEIVCRTCALPSKTGTCESCFVQPPSLNRVIAAFAYGPAVRDAVTSLKYRDIRALAPRLANLMADALPESVSNDADTLVPVPVTDRKLRSRGYNQSELLARHISKRLALPVESKALKRVNEARPQAQAVNIEERTKNVKDAFVVSSDVSGKRVLLVDDVMTTGSTLNACGGALKSAGATWTGALVLAREL